MSDFASGHLMEISLLPPRCMQFSLWPIQSQKDAQVTQGSQRDLIVQCLAPHLPTGSPVLLTDWTIPVTTVKLIFGKNSWLKVNSWRAQNLSITKVTCSFWSLFCYHDSFCYQRKRQLDSVMPFLTHNFVELQSFFAFLGHINDKIRFRWFKVENVIKKNYKNIWKK